MWPAYALSMVIFVLFTLGLWTRVTSVLSLFAAISYAHRVPAALFGLDQINVMLTLYLSIGPSGQTLSLDRWLLTRRLGGNAPTPAPSASANLAQRLIQFHMCVIYLFAGLSKLQGPSWWSGEAMWRAFANLEYQSLDMTWLAWHPWLVNMMTHVSVVWEISFCVLIWKPLWRPVMLAGAVVMHVGIGLCLGMWTFGLIMLVGCASFLPNEWVRRIVSAIDQRRGISAIEMDRRPLKPKRGFARILQSDRRQAQPATAGGPRARS
jgi:Vitamin K-dependent gamma-carboxylase